MATGTNWAGNFDYGASGVQHPATIAELQDIVRGGPRLKALGSRHSFNDIADTPGVQIALDRLPPVWEVDPARRTVTVGGAARYGEICAALDRAGWALPNLASLPHISVAGACATGTHGSGVRLGGLATSVAALELVTADGALVTLARDRDGDRFQGAVVGLGALGVVTRVTLDLVPAFQVRQTVYEALPLVTAYAHFAEIVSSAYSVSLFLDWAGDQVDQVWVKEVVPPGVPPAAAPATFFGAPAAAGPRHPIARLSAESCTEQGGVPGPWYARLPHFRMEFTPSSGAELQTEYLLPRAHAVPALQAIAGLREAIARLVQISEIRTVAADDLWLSPCYRQDSVAIHFTWLPDWPAVRAVLPPIEAALAPFAARPHWGKLFTLAPAALPALYPRLPDFQALCRSFDPGGTFRNAFLDRYISGVGSR